MNKFYSKFLLVTAIACSFSLQAQNNDKLLQLGQILSYDANGRPDFIRLGITVYESNAEEFLNRTVINNPNVRVGKLRTEADELGFTHTKYNLYYKNTLVNDYIIIVHARYGKIVSMNGFLGGVPEPSNQIGMDEHQALQKALEKVNAKKYKWENKAEENQMKQAFNDPSFSYYPNGDLILYLPNGKADFNQAQYAYKFNIYAEEPLYRANVIVDAQSGKVLAEQSLLCTVDVTATANTKYSGNQTITTDNFGSGQYRLRETGRGNGVETWNMNNGSTYTTSTDFVNATTTWSVAGVDRTAEDAHWGAEMTYDYYKNIHSRNSIDGNGFKLLGFVHYQNSYNNAFWNGNCMTYGDGDQSTFTGFTSIDICGHEITHGLVAKTASLSYGYNEQSALNESFADIFGTCIENYGRPSNWDWLCGKDVMPSQTGLRDLSNPNALGQPDTYLGTNWDTGGEPHQNNGPSNYWFYLLTMGGTGTNDNANTYTVNALGMTKSSKIAFRAVTMYFSNGMGYNNARICCTQAAADLYGNCSPEVIETTNAWYAVGVGPAFSTTINPGFSSPITSYCSYPPSVPFINTTAQAISYLWNFGDGVTSTSINPVHTYTSNGTYTVKMKAFGCSSLTDSVIKTAYISVNLPASSTGTGATRCGQGTLTLSASGAGQQYWYTSPTATGTPLYTGNIFPTPTVTNTTTYYVVNTFTNPSIYGAATSTAIGGVVANFPGNLSYLNFNTSSPCFLKSVVMYANSSGVREIELRNTLNVIISTYTVNLAAGSNTVPLNFKLQPGTAYRLGLSVTSLAALNINNNGASYPYNIGSYISIIGSSNTNMGFYYYFYNWEVAPYDCGGVPTAVTASINALPVVNGIIGNDSLCINDAPSNLSGTPVGGTFSGTGVSGTTFNPNVGVGTYSVIYTFTNGNNCTNSDTIHVVVDACVGIKTYNNSNSSLSVYPNPVQSVLFVSGNLNNTKAIIEISDALGKTVIKKQSDNLNNFPINVGELSSGVYFISISINEKRVVKKFVKQ